MIIKEKEIISSYKKNGYTVVKNLIPYELIEDVLKIYTRLIYQKPLIYTQSTHKWEEIQLDNEGLIIQSILNPSTLKTLHPLNDCLEEIIYHKNIEKVLSIIFNEKAFKIGCWQDMFFDKSTATIPHIDSWYLDTLPKGDLLGAWIALEDIDGKGGAFVVYPKTHLRDKTSEWSQLNHKEYLSWASKLAEKNKRKELLIKKGDAVFWHPSLLHGSTDFESSNKTRKSITAHYFPNNFIRSNGRVLQMNRDFSAYINYVKEQNFRSRSFGYAIRAQKRRRDIIKKNFFGVINKIRSKYNDPKMLMNRKYLNKTNYE